ncbi:hypothetical protein HDE_03612 [Halotydeus destructor]|nr:hypothetical protein HDE_03612 [Halotydeus destructor]
MADTVFQSIVQEIFVDDVMDCGPVNLPMELIIIQARQKPRYFDIDAVDSLGSMSFSAIRQLLIGLVAGAFFISGSSMMLRYRYYFTDTMTIGATQLGLFITNCCSAIFRQNTSRYMTWSHRIAWSSVCCALFIAIYGYALNQLSTDAVVEAPIKYAETMDDFLEDENRYDVHIKPSLFFMPRIKLALPTSKLGRLYRQLQRLEICSEARTCYLADGKDQSLHFVTSIREHDTRHISLMDKGVAQSVIKCIYPYVQENFTENVYVTETPLDETLGLVGFRKGLPRPILGYLAMRFSFVLEFGLGTKTLQEMAYAVPKNHLPFFKSDEWLCLDKPRDVSDPPVVAFTLRRMKKALKLGFVSFLLSNFVLLIESIVRRQFTGDSHAVENEPAYGVLTSVLQYKRNQQLYNWSAQFNFMSSEIGMMNASGHFDGMIGSLQRKETDILFHIILQEIFVHDSIVHGPVLMPLELVMTQAKQDAIDTSYLDVVNSLGSSTVSAARLLLYGLVTGAIFVACSQFILFHRRATLLRFQVAVKKSKQYFWIVCLQHLDKRNANYGAWSHRLLWASVCLSLFVTIFGYSRNSLSTDAMTATPFDYPDTADDLLSKEYYDAHIDKGLFFYPRFKQAKPSTSMGRLYRQLERRENCSQHRTCYFGPTLDKGYYFSDSIVERDPRFHHTD